MHRASLIFALFLAATVAMIGTLTVSVVMLVAKPQHERVSINNH